MITKAPEIEGQKRSTGEAWRVVGDVVIIGKATSTTYSLKDIVEIPTTEITSDNSSPTIAEVKEHVKGKAFASELTEEELTAILSMYTPWVFGEVLEIDDLRTYQSKLYRVVQAHTTQADWDPSITPALFVPISPAETIPDWVQPTGGHDAYSTGDQVLFNGQTYESTIDANVWSPEAYPAGWVLV